MTQPRVLWTSYPVIDDVLTVNRIRAMSSEKEAPGWFVRKVQRYVARRLEGFTPYDPEMAILVSEQEVLRRFEDKVRIRWTVPLGVVRHEYIDPFGFRIVEMSEVRAEAYVNWHRSGRVSIYLSRVFGYDDPWMTRNGEPVRPPARQEPVAEIPLEERLRAQLRSLEDQVAFVPWIPREVGTDELVRRALAAVMKLMLIPEGPYQVSRVVAYEARTLLLDMDRARRMVRDGSPVPTSLLEGIVRRADNLALLVVMLSAIRDLEGRERDSESYLSLAGDLQLGINAAVKEVRGVGFMAELLSGRRPTGGDGGNADADVHVESLEPREAAFVLDVLEENLKDALEEIIRACGGGV